MQLKPIGLIFGLLCKQLILTDTSKYYFADTSAPTPYGNQLFADYITLKSRNVVGNNLCRRWWSTTIIDNKPWNPRVFFYAYVTSHYDDLRLKRALALV